MKESFWTKLPRPFFVLAPMADVTDAAFRQIIAKYGKPDVLWTEFVSADGLMSAGREHLLLDLKYSENERPIVAQLFGANPEKMFGAACLVLELGFDGLDLNFGCPDRGVEKQGAGAALIKNPKLAREIIRAARAGVEDKIPVSVKTRLGYGRDELGSPTAGWLKELLAEAPSAITLHARTRQEMSKVPARWEAIRRAVEIRDALASETLIIGNGDLVNLEMARQKVAESGADGAMLGRAIFGNPFLFKGAQGESLVRKLRVMVEHTLLFEKLFVNLPVGGKSFAIMKKHYRAYVNGFSGANELRAILMEAPNGGTVAEIVDKYLFSVVP